MRCVRLICNRKVKKSVYEVEMEANPALVPVVPEYEVLDSKITESPNQELARRIRIYITTKHMPVLRF